jgi:hypothetical protein
MELDKKYIRPKCSHNKYKSKCVDCGGGSVCEHKKQKIYCKDCNGKAICEHNRIKYSCKDCKGTAICEHNKRKRLCLDCKGSGTCVHNKRIDGCKICNINNYLIKLQRDCVRRIFKNSSKFIKNQSTLDYLGCTIEHFKEFIMSKMEKDTCIDDMHIDHIKPVSSFNLEDINELKECCHYTNFQFLTSKVNLYKSNKWSNVDEIFWRNNIIFNDNYKNIYLPNI